MNLFGIIERISLHISPIKYWKRRGLSIGEDCVIYPSARIDGEPFLVKIGNHVRVNMGVHIVTHDGGVWVLRKYLKEENADKIDVFGRVTIGDNVAICTNAIILPGVTIGNNCIVGAGAIVTRSLPDNTVAAGVPARVIETIDDYAEKHRKMFCYTKHMSKRQKKIYLTRSIPNNCDMK